ncbi:hypothetical protein AVEN_164849-1 [Araneus ventricosus]|uniref:Uncharacterized protein n=1 Tax=Araneus ventricosus TaxID=182803 RepID=A0A4Y2IQP3_ARAVE|nr:hypothetical protein AVEN_164849-1 [Araneus ventricosus]
MIVFDFHIPMRQMENEQYLIFKLFSGLNKFSAECFNDEVCFGRGQGDLVVGCRPRSREGLKPGSTKIRRVLGLLHIKSHEESQTSPAGVTLKFGEGCAISGFVSFSTSDHDSKSRGPFQNSLHVVLIRDGNITKLN